MTSTSYVSVRHTAEAIFGCSVTADSLCKVIVNVLWSWAGGAGPALLPAASSSGGNLLHSALQDPMAASLCRCHVPGNSWGRRRMAHGYAFTQLA